MRRLFLLLLLAPAAAGQEPDPVAEAIARLGSDEVRDRARAAKTLGRLEDDRAVVALRLALGDSDGTVRLAATGALAKLKRVDANVIDVLVAALNDEDWYTRWQACLQLGALGGDAKAAIPGLVNAALDPRLDVTREAVHALARIARLDPAVQEAFVKLLVSQARVDRSFLLAHIGTGRYPAILPWFEKEFLTDERKLRNKAYRCLLKSGNGAASVFTDALGSETPRVRAMAAAGLAIVKPHDESVTSLLPLLDDAEQSVRIAAAAALGNMKRKSAVPHLIRKLDDKDVSVQIAAIRALGKLKTKAKEAAPRLVELLASDAQASWALAALDDVGFPVLAQVLQLGDVPRRKEGAPAPPRVVYLHLDRIRPEKAGAYQILVEQLRDNSLGPDLIAALRGVLHEGTGIDLAEHARTGKEQERICAAFLLGILPRTEWIRDVLKEIAARDPLEPVRTMAREGLLRTPSGRRKS